MQKITPFLWFDDNAEEAVKFYLSIFKKGTRGRVSRYGKDTPGPEGGVMTVEFSLFGQDFIALNGGPVFQFNESISFVVNCTTQREIDTYWKKLTAGGGKPVQCGWLKDKFGISWQIVPTVLAGLMASKDKAASDRVMQSMLKMVKLDIKRLKQAAAKGK